MATRPTYNSAKQHTRVRFQSLSWSCVLQCLTPQSPATQKQYLDLEIVPDRNSSPCCILPRLVVNDPDGVMDTSGGNMLLSATAYDSQYDYVRGHEWYVDGLEISSVWEEGADYELTSDTSDEYNGMLTIYRNLDAGEVVTLQYRGVFADSRTATNMVVVSDTMEIECLEAGSEELQMSIAPSIIVWNPLKDQRLLADYLSAQGEAASYEDDGQTYVRTATVSILQGTTALSDVPDGYTLGYYLLGTDTEVTESDAYVDSIDGLSITFDLRYMDDVSIEARLVNGDASVASVVVYYAASVSRTEAPSDTSSYHWDFDELLSGDDGNYFADSQGGADMVNTVGTITCVDGAAVFDGSQVLKTPFTMWNGDLTVAFWYTTTSTDTTQTILQSRLVVGNGLSVFLIGGVIRLDFGGQQWATAAAATSGVQMHIVLTVNWDSGLKCCYKDGELVGSTTATMSSQSFASYLWMGGTAASSTGPTSASTNSLIATIADLRIYDSALTADDVASLYEQGAEYDMWTTDLPTLSDDTPYLWYYYTKTATDGTTTDSTPAYVGMNGTTYTVPTSESVLTSLQGTGVVRCRQTLDLLYQPTPIKSVKAKNGCDLSASQTTYENEAIISTAKETVEYPECYYDINWYVQDVGSDTADADSERTLVGTGSTLSLDIADIGMDTASEDGAQFWVTVEADEKAAGTYVS